MRARGPCSSSVREVKIGTVRLVERTLAGVEVVVLSPDKQTANGSVALPLSPDAHLVYPGESARPLDAALEEYAAELRAELQTSFSPVLTAGGVMSERGGEEIGSCEISDTSDVGLDTSRNANTARTARHRARGVPLELVLLDGTWHQAKRLMNWCGLQARPRVLINSAGAESLCAAAEGGTSLSEDRSVGLFEFPYIAMPTVQCKRSIAKY